VNELLCEILSGRVSRQRGEPEGAAAVLHRSADDEQQLDGDESDRSEDDEFWSAGASADLFVGRVNALVEVLVDRGVIEAVPGADASGASSLDVRYIRPDPRHFVGQQQSQAQSADRSRRAKPVEEKTGVVAESGDLTSSDMEGKDKEELQKEFDWFFSQMVSE
jgi:hypothetical protein